MTTERFDERGNMLGAHRSVFELVEVTEVASGVSVAEARWRRTQREFHFAAGAFALVGGFLAILLLQCLVS